MNGNDKFAIATLMVIFATIIGLTCLLMSCGDEINTAINASKKATQDASPAIEHANGCPLDAVAYDAPAFASGWSDAYKVTDRFSKQEWWIVRMDGKWVVLPIESKEAVDVG